MTQHIFNTLLNHWESLRQNGEIPFRSEIDPRILPEVLESIFILEQVEPEQFRIRHSGMNLCEMMGFEVRGQQASSMMQNKYREKMTVLLGQVLSRPGIAEITLVAQDLNDNIVSLKMLLLPLRSDFGDVTRVIGCMTVPTVPYVAPLRFGIAGQKFTEISTKQDKLRGFAEDQAAFGTDGLRAISNSENPTLKSSPKRGHLRLVTDNDQDT